MTGRLAIVGLGPGAPELVTPLASETLTAASDLVGYAPYPPACRSAPASFAMRPTIARSWPAPPSSRACRIGEVCCRRVSGDPGVFAMASAVFEAIEAGKPAWRDVEVTVVPGVSAMLPPLPVSARPWA